MSSSPGAVGSGHQRSALRLLSLAVLALAAVSAAGIGDETCDAPPPEVLNFKEFQAFSLAHWQRGLVFCGFFTNKDRAAGHTMLANVHARVGKGNDALRFAWTQADDNTKEGGDLKSLFANDARCHVFKRRTDQALSAPEHTVSGAMDDGAFEEALLGFISEVGEAAPVNPSTQVFSDSESGDVDYMNYGNLDMEGMMAANPALQRPMCGGAPECEIERRSNLSPAEFVNEYYLWGRPVIVTDAMTHWPAMQKWTEEYVSAKAPALVARRKLSGESQLLSALDKEEQVELRRDYEMPYFLSAFNGSDSQTRPGELDTELFFFGEKGAKGLTFHLDTGCHQYWVPHFQGTKRWTMVPVESAEDAKRGGRHPAFQYPKLTATVMPGEILVFYSGWRHKTEYIDVEEPTLSFTMYLHKPVPKFYLNEYRHELITLNEYSTCMQKWHAPQMIVGTNLKKK